MSAIVKYSNSRNIHILNIVRLWLKAQTLGADYVETNPCFASV